MFGVFSLMTVFKGSNINSDVSSTRSSIALGRIFSTSSRAAESFRPHLRASKRAKSLKGVRKALHKVVCVTTVAEVRINKRSKRAKFTWSK